MMNRLSKTSAGPLWSIIMDNGSQYKIAFVIVTYNAALYVRKCIESICTLFKPKLWSHEIVIADNASTDETRAILADIQRTVKGLRVILLDRNIGFGLANNVCFSAVSAQYYVLLNPDAWLLADSISPALEALQRCPEIAVCGVPLVFPDGSPQTYTYSFSSWKKWLFQLLGLRTLAARLIRVRGVAALCARLPYGREFVRSQSRSQLQIEHIKSAEYSGCVRLVDWVCGAAMIIDGDFVREAGGFDPAILLYGEDEDLCIKAYRRNRKVAVVDAAPVAHVFGWGKNRFNVRVADIKFESLRYFIRKNINRHGTRLLMGCLLPFYVYGRSRFYHVWLRRMRSNSCRARRR